MLIESLTCLTLDVLSELVLPVPEPPKFSDGSKKTERESLKTPPPPPAVAPRSPRLDDRVTERAEKLDDATTTLTKAFTKYTLLSLPGEFSGLHLISIMYAAFAHTSPVADVGIDLSSEYAQVAP